MELSLCFIPVNNDRVLELPVREGGFVRDKVNVLVADDYSHNRNLHRLLLEREGAQVTLACNGREAIDKYKEHEEGYFDFIMMDVQMPEMDGFTAARFIRKWEAEKSYKGVDIYFVSGEYYNEEEVMAEFKTTGGSNTIGIRCLRKPVDIGVMKRVIDKYKTRPRDDSSQSRSNRSRRSSINDSVI